MKGETPVNWLKLLCVAVLTPRSICSLVLFPAVSYPYTYRFRIAPAMPLLCQPFIRLSWSHDLVDSTASDWGQVTSAFEPAQTYLLAGTQTPSSQLFTAAVRRSVPSTLTCENANEGPKRKKQN